MSGSNLETRSLIDELRSFDSGGFFDLGHPLLNRVAESFIKAAGIGAVQAVSRHAYFTAVESAGGDVGAGIPPEVGGSKKNHRIPDLRGENSQKSVEALVKSTGKESMQWGKTVTTPLLLLFFSPVSWIGSTDMIIHFFYVPLGAGMAAGVYSGLTYGLKEARGVHDWKNSALAGAITGAALALTTDDHSHEQVVQCAITGAAISTAANLLTGIF
ncbi:Outer envelope pore protein 16-2, chloroplastic [Sesamum angolense]|uniref:Outer envelope pore protein 16-2, chloroplastic n=1 Tax=Sesamum angolense TaxID=2727404 RepID=A0AAE1W7V5_9LAMI|nr:Outer envelope pore protein 16-2, chloroplastic [Sesamum angolense]